MSVKPKTLNLQNTNYRGELEMFYQWIGGTSSQIKYEYTRQAETDPWTCICKAYMPESAQALQTESQGTKKKKAMHQASKLMISQILQQPLPITIIVINEDGSTTNVDPMYSRVKLDMIETEHKLPDVSDAKDHDHEEDSKMTTEPKPAHISSLISAPFQIKSLENDSIDTNVQKYYASRQDDEYVSCYVYCIKYESDPYESPLGIILPRKINDNDLKSIQFPVQVRKEEEKQLTDLINSWVEEEKKLSEPQHLIEVRFDKEYIHDTEISLLPVKAKGGEYEHKIKTKYFNVIRECDKFMFETLDQRTSLNHLRCIENNDQKRFYCICPLKNLRGCYHINVEFIETMYLGLGGEAHKKLNAKEFRSKLMFYCNLKNEVVEIKNRKNNTTQVAISYGVEKRKFEKIRANRNESKVDEKDDATIASLASYAESGIVNNVDRLKGLNKEKFLNKASKADIMLVRVENPVIENVLQRAKNKQIKSYEIKAQMIYPFISTVFPTGITTNLWSKLKTIPAILYRVETWLNIIDLKRKLSNIYTQEMKSEEVKSNNEPVAIPMNIDLKLLFEAMHRSSSTTQLNYQILQNFGASILKFMSTLFLFINQPTRNPRDLLFDGITYSPEILSQTANRLNVIKYAILYNFKYDYWNPAQFEDREINSLYDLNTQFNTANDNIKSFESHLLQSIIGAIFFSFMQNSQISDVINGSLDFLVKCDIFSNVEKHQAIGKPMYTPNANVFETTEAINKLMDMPSLAGNNIAKNDMLEKSLKIVIEKEDEEDECKNDGITFERLETLGEVCLDLFVNLFMYVGVVDHIYNDQLGDKPDEASGKHLKANFAQYIRDKRVRFVNDKSLSYQFVKGGLDKFISWFDDDERKEIKTYKESISEDEKVMDMNSFRNDDNKEGEWFDVHRWSQQFDAPKALAQCYKALLGAIFVGSNPKIFDGGVINWNIKPSLQFVVDFLGNQVDWEEIVDQKLKHILF